MWYVQPPRRLVRRHHPVQSARRGGVSGGDRPPPGDEAGKPTELRLAHCRLRLGHPVVAGDVSVDVVDVVGPRSRRAVLVRVVRGTGGRVIQLNDHHAFLEVDPGSAFAPGDLVCLAISHSCTTLDKWRVIPVLDDEDRVIDVVHTFSDRGTGLVLDPSLLSRARKAGLPMSSPGLAGPGEPTWHAMTPRRDIAARAPGGADVVWSAIVS